MVDYLKPSPQGHLSTREYKEGDCKLMRYKGLSFSFYKEPMGRGIGETFNPQNPEWKYPMPKSVGLFILKEVCGQ